MSRNILELIHTPIKKVSTHQGGEYHGPCPVCGGRDRFHVWPVQREHGTFWCRACGIGGDAITFLRKVEGLTFQEACERLNIPTDKLPKYSPQRMTDIYTPRDAAPPANLTWQTKAAALAEHAHHNLLLNDDQLEYLASRGIDHEAVIRHRLGYLSQDYYRDRTTWGLPQERKENGRPRRLWLPTGLVIPLLNNGGVQRLRIRRPDGDPRYYVVPGSSTGTWCNQSRSATLAAAVVVESELDAILCAAAVDNMHVVSLGNSTARPDRAAHLLLTEAPMILVALDYDRAGADAARRWHTWYGDKVKRWPPPVGKDPGDAYRQGVSIGQWLKAALASK